MAGSCLNAWNENPDPVTLKYHLKQWEEPYRSTVHFADFIAPHVKRSQVVMDVGCGGGAPTAYLANRFSRCHFLGVDIAEELIAHAKVSDNLEFEVDNWLSLKVRFGIDGVVSMQALHCLPDPAKPLHQIATRIRPDWIAFSTLVYEGNINCAIVVSEPSRPRDAYYNIYGLPLLGQMMQHDGYKLKKFKRFEIDMDLPRGDPNLMGTYTIKTKGSRLQCSGPLMLPWGFCLFERRHGAD